VLSDADEGGVRLHLALNKLGEVQSLLWGFNDPQLRALLLRYAIENAQSLEK
jgi:hypothetical protein